MYRAILYQYTKITNHPAGFDDRKKKNSSTNERGLSSLFYPDAHTHESRKWREMGWGEEGEEGKEGEEKAEESKQQKKGGL